MTDEIKEMLKEMQEYASGGMTGLYFPENMVQNLLDYITNLQQDLDKAIDTIEKNRRFYKCRMDEYIDLKKENERLNNIINELEKWINNVKTFDDICAYEDYSGRFGIQPKYILDKLKELKESGNNE